MEGWCEALIETTRLRSSQQSSGLSACMARAKAFPSLVLTGLHDPIAPPARVGELAEGLSSLSRVSAELCVGLSSMRVAGLCVSACVARRL